jgi:hypothetical protein
MWARTLHTFASVINEGLGLRPLTNPIRPISLFLLGLFIGCQKVPSGPLAWSISIVCY